MRLGLFGGFTDQEVQILLFQLIRRIFHYFRSITNPVEPDPVGQQNMPEDLQSFSRKIFLFKNFCRYYLPDDFWKANL